jgi:thioredoxin 1
MPSLVELTDKTFENEVKSGIVLIDFWAPWCGPCRMQTPILESVTKKTPENVTIAKVNVEACPQTASRFRVQSIPTIILFKDGKEIKRHVGVAEEKTLLEQVENA